MAVVNEFSGGFSASELLKQLKLRDQAPPMWTVIDMADWLKENGDYIGLSKR